MEKKYKVLEEYINEVKKEKSMEQKKYKVEKSLPINIGLLVGHIYDESYFKYLDIARIIKEEYIKEVKEEKPMEQKKYRVLKSFYGSRGNFLRNEIISTPVDELFAKLLIDMGYCEEVKENTLESIIDENFIGDEIKKNLKQCIVKQKIELLKEVLEFIPISYSDFINNKISELQKEIK